MKKLLLIFAIVFVFIGCSNLENKIDQEEVSMFLPENNLPTDKRIEEIDNKVLDEKKEIAYFKGETEPFNGIFTLKYINHLLFSEEYKDGKLNGETNWYNNDGVLGMKYQYKDGKQDGEQYTYYENGNIRSVFTYREGKLDGKIEWYDKEGILIDRKDIINGTGEFILYWENGKIQEIGSYKNEKKFGSWKKYNKQGEILKEIFYSKKGQPYRTKWYR